MLHVTLRQLEYVVAVGKAGSLSEASNQLNVSQPALSVAIAHVENRVGELLFLRRKGVAITPTPFGHHFLRDAEVLLADAARLERPGALSAKRQTHATLGILEELAPRWMAPMLVLLRTTFQDTEISVLSLPFKQLTEALLTGQIDIGLTYDLGLDATFKRDLLTYVSPFIWVAPEDDLAVRPAVSLAEIADRPLILSDQDLSIQHMLGLFQTIGATPVVRHRAASIELLRSLAANGEGTGVSYTHPTGSLSYDGKLVTRARISDEIAVEPIVLAYIGAQSTPLPHIRMAIQELVKSSSQPDSFKSGAL